MRRHQAPTITVSVLRAQIIKILGATKHKRMAASGLKTKIRKATGNSITGVVWREAIRTEPRVEEGGQGVLEVLTS